MRSGESLAEYQHYLESHPEELDLLFEDLLIPATRFFRDSEVFDYLKRKVLAPLVKERRPADRPLRLWSVGCSTGEEAYSLAMIGLEVLAAHGGATGALQVFGTDLNESAVRRARAGHYSADVARQVGAERLKRFFVPADRGYRVSKALRDVCIFAQHNVVREAPFSHLDVICCRNVMIYMEPELQQRIFPVLHYALNPEGILVLGSAEGANSASDLFRPLATSHANHRKLRLFQKVSTGPAPHFELRPRGYGLAAAPHAAPLPPRPASEEARKEADRIVLGRFAPAGVIVDSELEVLEYRGRTSRFLEPAPGEASLNLMKMARGNLGAYVRSAVIAAQKTGAAVHRPGLLSALGDDEHGALDLEVVPLAAQVGRSGHMRPLFLVLFQASVPAPERRGRGTREAARSVGQRELEHLRRNLADSQNLIRSLSEEYQAAKQEYQAATEEIASANEELQSSSEELETSKEELQSANEEISTINEELRHRNTDLYQANADLQNLIAVAGFAVVLLDRELRIRRFSPAAEKIFSLIPADAGRRITDIRASTAVADVESLALATFASGSGQHRQVQDAGGRWFDLRVSPYFSGDKQVDGLVLSLIDIDDFKRTTADLLRAMMEPDAAPLAMLDQDQRILRVNEAFRRVFPGAEPGERWNPPALRHVLSQLQDHAALSFTLAARGGDRSARIRRFEDAGGTLLVVTLSA